MPRIARVIAIGYPHHPSTKKNTGVLKIVRKTVPQLNLPYKFY